jgi:shikimate dehydrogenase
MNGSLQAAVLGSPISHSLSPVLHRKAYEILGISATYSAIDTKEGQLANFVSKMDSSWLGISLTMPLKEEVLKVADEVDPLALRIQSANTLYRVGDKWRATSTDVAGFSKALAAMSAHDFASVVILGAGATARCAAAAFDGTGRSITVLIRSDFRKAQMEPCVVQGELHFVPWSDLSALRSADLIVNTTPAGVADEVALLLDHKPDAIFFEALYNPWPTRLLQSWLATHSRGIDGLDLLVQQAIDQIELQTKSVRSMDLPERSDFASALRSAGLSALGGNPQK